MSKKFSSYSATFLGRKTSNPSPPVDKYVGLGGGSTLPAINGCGGPRPCKAAQNLPHIPQMHCPSHQDCFQYFRLFSFCVSAVFLPLYSAVSSQLCLLLETLPKAQRTRGLNSSCKSKFLRSYQKFENKSWSHFIFRISSKHQLKISIKHHNLHST